jgi:hypothetical protein
MEQFWADTAELNSTYIIEKDPLNKLKNEK